ncbi:hypothetical protein NL529_29480, partial [Klebsiella pneumoniae]|nr:hypothetical protein [Klebsiella pneumoniae]
LQASKQKLPTNNEKLYCSIEKLQIKLFFEKLIILCLIQIFFSILLFNITDTSINVITKVKKKTFSPSSNHNRGSSYIKA